MNAHLVHALYEILVVLGSAIAVLVVCSRLRIPPVVGLIVSGFLIGPQGTGLIHDREMVELFAEVGVVLLLFSIGLELSLEKLTRARRAFALGGPLQALFTGLLAFTAAVLAGLSPAQALFVAFLIVLSSTAVVLKIYNDRREMRTSQGELSLGILLFQDLLLVPMVVVTPLLAGAGNEGIAELGARLGGAVLAAGVAFLVARVILPPVLSALARGGAREALLLSALFLGLGMAYLTGILGLSPALGAFLGGVAAAESPYHHQLMADVGPFRDVFTSLFFVSIGMLVVLPSTIPQGLAVLGVALLILLLKALATFVAIRMTGFALRPAFITALGLAQLGEFSFLLMAIGMRHELLPQNTANTLLAAAVVTLLVTPLAIAIAPSLANMLPRKPAEPVTGEPLRDHTILIGFGLIGRTLAQVLHEASIRFRVAEMNKGALDEARDLGYDALYGDATRVDILEALGARQARVLIVPISDPRAERQIVTLARGLNSNLRILAVVQDTEEVERLASLGADRVISVEFESALEVLHETLESYHVPRNVVRAQTRVLRGEDYRMLRSSKLSEGANRAVLDALTEGTTEIVRILDGSPAAGASLRELDLRNRSGASVIAVVRDTTPHPNPDPDHLLQPGDDLVLVGGHAAMERAFALLRKQENKMSPELR